MAGMFLGVSLFLLFSSQFLSKRTYDASPPGVPLKQLFSPVVQFSLVLSVRYTAAEKTMRRTPSKQSTAVFGVRICACAKREGKTVPTIVTACVQEVERRGNVVVVVIVVVVVVFVVESYLS